MKIYFVVEWIEVTFCNIDIKMRVLLDKCSGYR